MLIDILFLFCLALGFFIGYRSGVIRSVFSFVGLFLGAAVAVKFTGLASQFLYDTYDLKEAYWPLLVFIALFVIVLLLVKLLAILLEKVLQGVALGILNKVSGALLWSLLMVFFLSLGLWFADEGELIRAEVKADSSMFEYVRPIAPWAIDGLGQLIPWFKGMFELVSDQLDDLANELS